MAVCGPNIKILILEVKVSGVGLGPGLAGARSKSVGGYSPLMLLEVLGPVPGTTTGHQSPPPQNLLSQDSAGLIGLHPRTSSRDWRSFSSPTTSFPGLLEGANCIWRSRNLSSG